MAWHFCDKANTDKMEKIRRGHSDSSVMTEFALPDLRDNNTSFLHISGLKLMDREI